MNGKKSRVGIKNVLLVLALLIFAAIAIIQILDSADIKNDTDRIILGVNGTGDDTFGASLKGRPVPMGQLMGLVSGGNFNVIDKNGDTKTTENFMLSDPVVSAKGKYCAVADYGGNTARLYEKGKVMAEVETEGDIISVVTNANGFFAVASKEAGYEAVIVVYTKAGKPIYKYNIANNTFLDMDISSNNRKLIITQINLAAGSVGTNVVVAELNRNKGETSFYVSENVYTGVHFNKNGSYVCLGNEKTDIYASDGTLQETIDYGGRKPIASDISEDNMICLAFRGADEEDAGVATLEIYDKAGKLRGKAVFDEEIENIAVNGSYASIAHGNKLDIVKSGCKVIKSFETTSPIKYGAPFSDGSAAVVFSGGNTTIVK